MQSKTKTYLDFNKLNEITQNAFNEGLKDFSELTDGWFNSAYKIETQKGRRAVLKIAPPKDILVMQYEKDIMKAEVDVMNLLLEKTAIPIPKVLAYDTSGNVIEQEYYIMEMLDGKPYNHVKENMTESARQEVEEVLGKYNKQINSVTSDKFGYFADCHKKYDTWHECFSSMIDITLQDAEKFNVDIGEKYEKLADMVKGLKEVLNVISQPKLTHWDLWDGNVFVKDGKITGIIDFERSLWGDNLMEVYFYNYDNKAFCRGYNTDESDMKHFDLRTALYGYYMALIMIVEGPFREYTDDDHSEWKKDLIVSRRKRVDELIAKL